MLADPPCQPSVTADHDTTAADAADRAITRAAEAKRAAERIHSDALEDAIRRAEAMTAEVHALERAHHALDTEWVKAADGQRSSDLSRRLDDAHRLWTDARARQEKLITAILDIPAKSAAMASAKLDAFERLMGGGRRLETEEDITAALEAARNDLRVLGGTVAVGAAGAQIAAQWQAVLAEFQDAAKCRDEAITSDHQQTAAMNLQGPERLQGRSIFYDFSPKWSNKDDLDRDVLLTEMERQELLPEVMEWDRQRSEALRTKYAVGTQGAVDDERFAAIMDRYDTAASALIGATPPSLADLILQQRLIGGRLSEYDTDLENGFDDLGWCCEQRDERWRGRPTIQAFINLVRLAGLDHPLLHLDWFSPMEWVKAFEGAGGMVSSGIRGLHIVPPKGQADVTVVLMDRLYAAPHHFWAVKLYADKRKAEGGDPIFDCWNQFGARDNRVGNSRFFGTVFRCDLVQFVRNSSGGSPNPIITKIDRRPVR